MRCLQLYACNIYTAGLVCIREATYMPDNEIQSLGGKARADKLSKADRSAIAKAGAEARWEKAARLFPPAHRSTIHRPADTAETDTPPAPTIPDPAAIPTGDNESPFRTPRLQGKARRSRTKALDTHPHDEPHPECKGIE